MLEGKYGFPPRGKHFVDIMVGMENLDIYISKSGKNSSDRRIKEEMKFNILI